MEEQEDKPEEEEEVSARQEQPKLFSKVQWKRKRYLMMQDVKESIQQGHPQASRKAQTMVRRMLSLYEKSNDMEFAPTEKVYNLWIHALAKSGMKNSGILAEQVLEEMKTANISPSMVTYTSVMDAYAKSDTPERTNNILEEILKVATTTNKSAAAAAAGDWEFSHVACDTILNALAQQGTRDGAERAQLILYRLEDWGRADMKPTKISYATGM